jgi:hypothetical protein
MAVIDICNIQVVMNNLNIALAEDRDTDLGMDMSMSQSMSVIKFMSIYM